ncbi:MAG: glutathione S-transferase [Methylibium sp. NZG]|nr:MAG: glutathione S-transferase [Methylibium sp. NZG]
MTELILHHYASSPFSEKIRLIFGFKGLAWRSVYIPQIMPKPDVVALTGGYRKTPFLQIGADIYCDSALMARVIDRLHPEPTLYPKDVAGAAHLLAQWADSTLFWSVIPYTMQPAGIAAVFNNAPPEAMKAFAADRAPFSAGMTRQTPADATAALRHYLGWLESMLADGRPHLSGIAASIADFSVAHCLWFVHRAPPLVGIFEPFPRLGAWFERVRAFGHGQGTRLGSIDAVTLAAATSGHAPTRVEPGLGFEPGDAVTVMAIDTGRDPVAGTLVGLNVDEVTIERRDERAGTVHVHFPRIGFQIKKEKVA